jgi:hypothetical protein
VSGRLGEPGLLARPVTSRPALSRRLSVAPAEMGFRENAEPSGNTDLHVMHLA